MTPSNNVFNLPNGNPVSLGDVVNENKLGGRGGDGGNGMLDARVAKLESDIEYIKRDIAEVKEGANKFLI